jgi:hypothetical protein
MKQKATVEALRNLLNEMSKCIKDGQLFYKPHFLEVVPGVFKKHRGGFIVVDRTKSCYPLIFYPIDYNKNEGHRDRPRAFLNALDDVIEKIDKIQPILIGHENWEEKQAALFEILPFEKQQFIPCASCGDKYLKEEMLSPEESVDLFCPNCAYQE